MPTINNFNADEKILHHLDKINNYFNGCKTLIVTELDLTNKCNNRCPGCCGINTNRAELNKEQIDNIILGLKRMENRGVILSGGGEPLISPYFEYAITKIRKNGMKIGCNSNGLALTEEKAKIIANNCEYFRISLDAGTPETYLSTHGMPKNAFEKVIQNAKQFDKVRKEANSPVSFGIGYLTCKETEKDMENFVKLAKSCGADFAQFRPFTGDIHDVSNKISALQKKYNDETFTVTASIQKYREMKTQGERGYNKCRGMFFSTVITADAKVFACLHFRQSDKHYLGEITSALSLENIFQSARIREVFQNIDCSDCPILCRNDVFNRTLNTLSLDVNHKEFL